MEKLHKIIDGEKIFLNEEEEKHLRIYWDLKERYKEYSDSILYDGASMPTIDIEKAKILHHKHLQTFIDNKVKEINSKIETFQENGDDPKDLFLERKRIKDLINQDLSKVENLEDLKKLFHKGFINVQ